MKKTNEINYLSPKNNSWMLPDGLETLIKLSNDMKDFMETLDSLGCLGLRIRKNSPEVKKLINDG